ncbi:MAG: hypothetical protein J6N93_04275 [Clostridia bacterium]|nr:hypothetical protein [Clostridia bacterium]
MIHSLAGGVIKSGGLHTFVKVKFPSGEERWYLSDDTPVMVGLKVAAPYGGDIAVGIAVRVDGGVSEQATPIPFKRAEKIISVIFDEEE